MTKVPQGTPGQQCPGGSPPRWRIALVALAYLAFEVASLVINPIGAQL